MKQLALVHCEVESAEALATQLAERGVNRVIIPSRGQAMPLDSPA